MATAELNETELWDALVTLCGARGALEFGASLLGPFSVLGPDARRNFLGAVVAAARDRAAFDGNELGPRFLARANTAFAHPSDGISALVGFLELRDEVPELSVDEFFDEVVCPPDQAMTVPDAPNIQVVQVSECGYLTTLPRTEAQEVAMHLAATTAGAPLGEPRYWLELPAGDMTFLIGIFDGSRGPYVEARVEDSAGMERTTWPPRREFFGEYAGTVNGQPFVMTIEAAGG